MTIFFCKANFFLPNYHRGGNNFHHGGNNYHRGGNRLPPRCIINAVGCCPVGCCPASGQWRHQPIFIGVQWRIRGGGGAGGAHPPPPSGLSMIVIMLPPARSFVTYRCITCQALPVYSWSNYGCAPPPP